MNYECMSFQANGVNYDRIYDTKLVWNVQAASALCIVDIKGGIDYLWCVCIRDFFFPFWGKIMEEDKDELTNTI